MEATVERVDGGADGGALVRGPHLDLHHVRNSDIPAIQRIVTEPQARHFWRSRGFYWSPAEVQARLAKDSFCSLVVTPQDDRESVIGLVELVDYEPLDARAQLSLVMSRRHHGTALGVEAAIVFMAFSFEAYRLEKISIMTHSANDRLVGGLRRHLDHEGTLKRHLNLHGHWEDVDVFAVWPADIARLETKLRGVGPWATA
jgi:RimJ/RimL family protein N-acetyltransferase